MKHQPQGQFTTTDQAFLDGLSGNKELGKKYCRSQELWLAFTDGLRKYYIRKNQITGGNNN